MAVIKDFREAEARFTGKQPEGWGEMMVGLDEEDPKGRGTGKRRKSETVEKEEATDSGDHGTTEPAVKKRKASRKKRLSRAVSSASKSEIGIESVGSSADTPEGDEQLGHGRGSAPRGRARRRGRAPSRTQSGEISVD